MPEIWAGLLITAMYFMQIGPNILNINDRLEDGLALLLFFGSLICLTGVVLGTKWFFKRAKRRSAYILELIGLPMVVFSLGWYTYASVDAAEFLVTALAGGLGMCIEIGCVRMVVDLVEDLNIDHSEHDHD